MVDCFIETTRGHVNSNYLFVEGILVEELHRLQMRVKLIHHCQVLFQEVLDNIPHRHVVRQSDFVADGYKFAASESKR